MLRGSAERHVKVARPKRSSRCRALVNPVNLYSSLGSIPSGVRLAQW